MPVEPHIEVFEKTKKYSFSARGKRVKNRKLEAVFYLVLY